MAGTVTRLSSPKGLCGSNAEIASELRSIAAEIESAPTQLRHLILVESYHDGELSAKTIGAPIDTATLVGLLSLIQHGAMSE